MRLSGKKMAVVHAFRGGSREEWSGEILQRHQVSFAFGRDLTIARRDLQLHQVRLVIDANSPRAE